MQHTKTELVTTVSEYGDDLIVEDIELDDIKHKLSITNKGGLILNFDDGNFIISLTGGKLTFSRKRYSGNGDISNPLEQTLAVSNTQEKPVWVPAEDSEISKPLVAELSRPFMVPFGSVKEGSVKDENVSLKEAE